MPSVPQQGCDRAGTRMELSNLVPCILLPANPKQMAPQMKCPVVSGLQKGLSLRGLHREKSSASANSLGLYNVRLGVNHRTLRMSKMLGAAEFCKPCQLQEML